MLTKEEATNSWRRYECIVCWCSGPFGQLSHVYCTAPGATASTSSLCPQWQREALVRHDKCPSPATEDSRRDPPFKPLPGMSCGPSDHVPGSPPISRCRNGSDFRSSLDSESMVISKDLSSISKWHCEVITNGIPNRWGVFPFNSFPCFSFVFRVYFVCVRPCVTSNADYVVRLALNPAEISRS